MDSNKIPSDKTIIDINGMHTNDNKSHHCGYCKNKKPNAGHSSWGITSLKMTVNDYKKLMDRGWRRCGTYYYKYDLQSACCRPYTIKLDTNEYYMSNS